MASSASSDGFLRSIGEAVGGFFAGLPSGISSFFSGLGAGAGVHGVVDWIAFVIGIALLLSVITGIRRGRVVGPAVRGFLGVMLMGWAVS